MDIYKIFSLWVLILVSASAQAQMHSQCVTFDREKESHNKLLLNSLKKENIKFSTTSSGAICYQPKDESNVSSIIKTLFPSVIPGPDYALFSHNKYAQQFHAYLKSNGVTSKIINKQEEVIVTWSGENYLLVRSAINIVRQSMAKEVKLRASELKESSNKRIKSFATAHSDRHKAAAVYATRYAQ